LSERVDVVVVGAGISGLAAALGAQRKGASVLVLEASDRIGGVIQSSVIDDFLIEHGPNSFAANAASMTLVRELGIENDVLQPSPMARQRYVVKGGTLRALPHSPPSLLSSNLLSWRGKLRALSEALVSRGHGDEESLASFVRRRFGHEILDYVVDPFVSGVYAGDPERLSSRYAMRIMSELEQQYGSVLRGAIGAARARRKRGETGSAQPHSISFRHGLQQLPAALANALHLPVRLHAQVTRISKSDDGWTVNYTDKAGTDTVHASRVVIATPAHALQRIEWPASAREYVAVLQQIPHASIATVALGFPRTSIAHALDGFGMLVPSVEKRDILGALFNSTLYAGRAPETQALLTVFIGGARKSSLGSDGDVTYVALRELQALLDISALPTISHVTRWENGIPQYVIGHGKVLAAAKALEDAHPGLAITGSYLLGVSLGDCIANGLEAGARVSSMTISNR
jgi:oxygen-dependent protoporphyrinogen oxidase